MVDAEWSKDIRTQLRDLKYPVQVQPLFSARGNGNPKLSPKG